MCSACSAGGGDMSQPLLGRTGTDLQLEGILLDVSMLPLLEIEGGALARPARGNAGCRPATRRVADRVTQNSVIVTKLSRIESRSSSNPNLACAPPSRSSHKHRFLAALSCSTRAWSPPPLPLAHTSSSSPRTGPRSKPGAPSPAQTSSNRRTTPSTTRPRTFDGSGTRAGIAKGSLPCLRRSRRMTMRRRRCWAKGTSRPQRGRGGRSGGGALGGGGGTRGILVGGSRCCL